MQSTGKDYKLAVDEEARKRLTGEFGYVIGGCSFWNQIALCNNDIKYLRDVVFAYPPTRRIFISKNYAAWVRADDNNTLLKGPELINVLLRRYVLCEKFLLASDCPSGVRTLLTAIAGLDMGHIQGMLSPHIGDTPRRDLKIGCANAAALLAMRRPYIERWFETCR